MLQYEINEINSENTVLDTLMSSDEACGGLSRFCEGSSAEVAMHVDL